MYTVEQITKAVADANISEYWMNELFLSLTALYGSEPQQLLQQTDVSGSFYNFPTIIESFNVQYRVVGQNGSLPVPLFYGTYAECVRWRSENCR